MKWSVLVFAAGLVAGFWIGGSPVYIRASPRPAPVSQKHGDRPVERKWTKEDFQARASDRVAKASRPGYDPYGELFADWSEAEIHAALDEGLKNPDYVLEGGSGGGMMDALFGEWMKRDLEAAIAWFDSVKIESARHRMAPGLSYRWPAEQAARGLEFVIANKDLFPRGSPWSILVKNFEASAREGPAALGGLLGRITDEELRLDFGNAAKLPAGFDFAAFVQTDGFLRNKNESAVTGLLASWMAQDRETAFDWYLASDGPAKLIDLVPDDIEGSHGYWEWLGGKLTTLDPSQRDALLAAAGPLWEMESSSAASFAKRIDDRALREKVHEQAAQAIFRGEIQSALEHLEGIADPARRIEILTSMQEGRMTASLPFRQPVTGDDIITLRKKLGEWRASESQIEAIVKKIQP